MKKNIYLVQAGCLYGNTYYLPYAVGMLAAFAFDDPVIKENYNLGRMIYALEDIDELVSSLEEPFFVGLSNYIWNYDYNIRLAEKIKERYPDCLIQFGGHQVPPNNSFLEKYPFIDFLGHGKGEESFLALLKELLKDSPQFDYIPNISFRNSQGNPVMTKRESITICEYPSPYLSGVFDSIIKDSEYSFSCVLETNRGCPFNCAYCDWGDLNSKIRPFPIERVYAELEWMAENHMEFIYCVDSNFGILERDVEIAAKMIDLKNKYGYPKRLQVSYTKDNPQRVFEINTALTRAGLSKGATMSLQSLSDEVLFNIGRKNYEPEHYRELLGKYRKAGIPTYSELILGLPGETCESFCRGLCELIEMGQHNSVSAYYCELLPGSRMSTPEYMSRYKIQTVCTSLGQWHCEPMDDELPGHSNIVVGTYSLTREEWVECNIFSFFVQAMHHFGLLRYLAVYIRKEKGISYYDFYNALMRWISESGKLTRSVYERISSTLHNFVSGEGGLLYQNDVFGKITWTLEESVFLDFAFAVDEFYKEITPFLSGYITDEHLFDELMKYQKNIIVLPKNSVRDFTVGFNFYDYFLSAMSNESADLIPVKQRVIFKSDFAFDSWVDYSRETVWYGRRNGRMVYTSYPEMVSVTDI